MVSHTPSSCSHSTWQHIVCSAFPVILADSERSLFFCRSLLPDDEVEKIDTLNESSKILEMEKEPMYYVFGGSETSASQLRAIVSVSL